MNIVTTQYNDINNVMIDIETFGTGSQPVIIQIAAVQFNPFTGETLQTINLPIEIQSSLDIGLNVDWSTLKFWFEQEAETIQSVIFAEDRIHIRQAFTLLKAFILSCNTTNPHSNVQLWGKGPTFDLSKLSKVYELLDSPLPWKYWNEKCVRTIIGFNKKSSKKIEFTGKPHDAIDDCIHQVKQVTNVIQQLCS